MADLTIHEDVRLQVDLRVKLGGARQLRDIPIPSPPRAEASSRTASKIHPRTQPDWNNLNVLHRNTLAPRSYFHVYDSEAAARSASVAHSRAQLLSGSWGFHLASSPFAGPKDFWKSGYNHAEWPLIKVPGSWQMQGFGKGPQYTNVNYPFPVDPPNVPFDDNECGRYVTVFEVLPGVKDGKQFRLRFEGVDAAFTVWLNGKEVGYSQGSRNPSEFDVTGFLDVDGTENTLCVEVYQRCDGSYIEDQDQWWLSGIFRDVWLHSFPETHFEDFQIQTLLDDEFRHARLHVKTTVSQAAKDVHLKLFDADGKVVVETPKNQSDALVRSSVDGKISTQEFHIKDPHKWTAETPYLYTLLLEVDGLYTSHKVGFRRAELIDGVFCVNGSPIKIRGVNRHEHHPESGRTVPYEFLRRDLRTMKLFSINAIRTSHYPNDPRLYDLANEFGFWVIDEADLECHGFEEAGGLPASYTSDNPEWREAYVDRARQLVARDKNHPCVIMWSLGNEAFYGRNHQAMYDEMKRMDATRLIHYEQDYDAKTADVFSRMYTSVGDMIKFGEEKDWKKPFVMCEFGHAMGNGPGGLKEYIDAFYKYPRLMGGFIWEWANHGLLTKSEDGEYYFGYGGDFGDEPNDGNFVMDGLCNSLHNQGPGLNDYSALIQPVQIVGMDGFSIEIVNRYDFRTLDHLKCYWSIISDRNQIIGREIPIPKGVKPHTTAMVHLRNGFPATLAAGAWLELEFVDTEVPGWSYPNRTVARCQVQMSSPTSLAMLRALDITSATHDTASSPRISTSPDGLVHRVTLANDKTFGFDTSKGTLSFMSYSSGPDAENLITEPVTLDFYRALTDNDRPVFGQEWLDARLHQTRQHFTSMTTTPVTTCSKTGQTSCSVSISARVAPPVLAWAVDTVTTYTFTPTTCSIRVQAKPHGPFLPSTFARFGLSFGIKDVNIVEWFGRGPEQSYVDFKAAQSVNTWGWSVDGLWHDYEFPQDNGNRSDVAWVELRQTWGGGEKGRTLRARFGDFEGASFTVSRFATRDIDEARHPFELNKKRREGDVLVRLDWFHHGLGTGSCGPATLPQYQLRTDREFDVEVLLD
ncbi:glycosyl hydrolases family 2, TIM barrel domain-containing protein [Microdochium trichocladiopsis]|uniref:beta-galactosidase n=1 Tax=Microdochium trichocladiopsis TaxID=1682393 RepID=A0A9P8Y2M4_9PEZI|nr:glycosyl hydrolases family 2, TIM barrel domain-containing protein [Microdochium trichocladiopsis]KAH7028082.1 glycosyl hydrolases family 2, TIM barrel domain-containing protein [Microdochium trichocladiopsis]